MTDKTQIAILKGIFGMAAGIVIGVLIGVTSGQSGAGIVSGVSIGIGAAIVISIGNIRKLWSQ